MVCREREVLYDRREHGASAGGGVQGAKGGTTGAPRAPGMPLGGMCGEQRLKGYYGALKTHQM